MASKTIIPVGMKETSVVNNWLDEAVIELDLLGYTTVPSDFSDEELQDLSHRCDAVMETQRTEAGGAEHMKTDTERHIARAIIAYDDTFLKVCRHPKILELIERVIGKPIYLNQQNAILNPPGNKNYISYYHRDFPYQHFTSSHPLSLTALLCIDDFTLETGPTMMLPASHKICPFPDEAVWSKHEVPLIAPKGTFLVFDSMTFHRTGHNKSKNFRRAIAQAYSIPLVKQVISLPRMLKGKYSDDKELSKFFGYDFETADTVLDFRKERDMAKK